MAPAPFAHMELALIRLYKVETVGKGIPHSAQALTVKASQSQSKEDICLKAGRNGEEPLKFYECNFTMCIMDLALKM